MSPHLKEDQCSDDWCLAVEDVPGHAHGLGLALKHAGPGPLIIGDSQSLFHKPTVVRLGRD